MFSERRRRRPGGYGIGGSFTLNSFPSFIDFTVPSVRGGTQPYGNNTDDGRLFRDPNNITAGYIPNAAGTLVLQANAGLRRTDLGHSSWPSYGTCRNLWARDWTNVAWVSGGGGGTSAKTSVGADGVANSATRLTASGANATWLQSITLASSTVLFQVQLKRITGTGNVDLTVDGGTTWTTVTPGAGVYALVSTSQAAVTNPVVGIRLVSNGDAVDVDFGNTYSNPPNSLNVPSIFQLATVGSTILGSQSRPTADQGDAAPKTFITIAQNTGAFFWKGKSSRATGAFVVTGAAAYFVAPQADGSVRFTLGATPVSTPTGLWKTDLTSNKVCWCWNSAGLMRISCNGQGAEGSGGTLQPTLDHFDGGTNGSGANSLYGWDEQFGGGAGLFIPLAIMNQLTT